MDLLWLIGVVLAWGVLLKWVVPRFKLTACGRAGCTAAPPPPADGPRPPPPPPAADAPAPPACPDRP